MSSTSILIADDEGEHVLTPRVTLRSISMAIAGRTLVAELSALAAPKRKGKRARPEVLQALREIERLRPEGGLEYDEAVGRFVCDNKGLAVKYAERWLSPGLSMDDLIQAAMLGLLVAARRWESARAADGWTSWATIWMRSRLQAAVRQSATIQITDHARRAADDVEERGAEGMSAGRLALAAAARTRVRHGARLDRLRVAAPEPDAEEEAMAAWCGLPAAERERVAAELDAPDRDGDRDDRWGRRVLAWCRRGDGRAQALLRACTGGPETGPGRH